ncbi:type III-B CRISPR module-associated protein Cmr5 [Vibrio metschnikovii]|nr:type III-B CRISPR module-associated protein Cmr5 [Vibrio metschnikovii]
MAKYKRKQQEKQNRPVEVKKVEPPAPQLLEQKRAEFALNQIKAALELPEDGKYKHSQVKSFCRRFPGMVQSNGFGQAVAFFYSKRNDYPAYGTIYTLVEKWLCRDGQVYGAFNDAAEPKLLTAITQSDQNAYRQASAETQALMIWVKKFAEGLILKEEEGL